jgi:hypothetical protein
MHLQFLDERRLRAKQALYKMTEVLRWPAPTILEGVACRTPEELALRLNMMYGRAVYESDPAKVQAPDCPIEWWDPYQRILAAYRFQRPTDSRPPWQEVEVKALAKIHGLAKFRGLDLFGVV